jgi:hypothetical protein
MIKSRNIQFLDFHASLLEDEAIILKLRSDIKLGDLVIVRNAINPALVQKLKEYLKVVASSSLPNYVPIQEGAPNFHRVNQWDERSYVKCCFHQFTFFPWNSDVFNLFEITKNIFYLKNLINGQPKDKFMKTKPEDGCTARLSFQFYPKGIGGMNKHSDPVDHHQLTVPTLIMSKKGLDFETGGMYVENENGEYVFGDDLCEIGDVILFNAQVPHGVKIIDEHKDVDWLSFEGRWMMIFATNKLQNNSSVADAVDLESNAGKNSK